jgi:predicted GNAT family N-acyltransferase
MAVLRRERRSGLGAQIIGALEQLATEAGLREAELHAQLRAAPFYAACGYTARGAEYEEEGIPHVSMVKRLAP